MVAGVLAGPRTPEKSVRVVVSVLVSDAGLVASKPVVSDKPWKRVEVEIVVLRSVPGVKSEAVSTGTCSETVGLRSNLLVSFTSVVKTEDDAFGGPRETVRVGRAALISKPGRMESEVVISGK